MSKIGTLNLELQEQANELGFSTVQEALDNGYEIIHTGSMGEVLRSPDGSVNKRVLPLDLQAYIANEMEDAHKAWEEEKKKVLGFLKNLRNDMRHNTNLPYYQDPRVYDYEEYGEDIERAIKFVEEAHE